MPSVEGVMILTQESRFKLVGGDGVHRHFTLDHGAAAEPQDLEALVRDGARVRVAYRERAGYGSAIAVTIDVLGHEAGPMRMGGESDG